MFFLSKRACDIISFVFQWCNVIFLTLEECNGSYIAKDA